MEKNIDFSKNYFDDSPFYLREFLIYISTILGRSQNTVKGYYTDIKSFLRYVKLRYLNLASVNFNEININDVSIEMLKTIELLDVYEYLHFCMNDLSNNDKARARKVSALRTFYKYLTVKSNLLENNPVKELEIPSLKKSLPKYLSLNESVTLLENVSSSNKIRDFCILTLFLNCGMRLSELVGINLEDIKDNTLKLLGKGNKERIIYLNEQCINTIEEYSKIRPKDTKEKNALFISKKGARLSKRRVQEIVTYNLEANGLNGYSTHKLRHTAATLLYQYGNVDINILKELLGHENLGTTQIYTHISNKQLEDASLKSPLKSVKSPKSQK